MARSLRILMSPFLIPSCCLHIYCCLLFIHFYLFYLKSHLFIFPSPFRWQASSKF
nr:MAG TPA: hypothetical protein [Caudoviricetes sp.]